MDCMDPNDSPRFRPFGCHVQVPVKVKKAKYSTSLDPRGLLVYEYMINGQPIMWDRETGYVHFTGIWKSLNNSKADIVKMVDSNPDLKVKKIRGGFLKIQGTWIPYEYALILCKRTAYHVRKELVPVFGARFVDQCLEPDHTQYGCLLLDPNSTRPPSSRTTMRQSSHPYKRDYMRRASRDKPVLLAPRQQDNDSVSCMSLSRLLNQSQATSPARSSPLSVASFLDAEDTAFDMDTESPLSPQAMDTPDSLHSPNSPNSPNSPSSLNSLNSPNSLNSTPSPTFPRDFHSLEHDWYSLKSGPVLAPIYTACPTRCRTPPLPTHLDFLDDLQNGRVDSSNDQDTLEQINASIILYCMSQNAARDAYSSFPLSPLHLAARHQERCLLRDQPMEENVVG
ncbi:hypothetical protein BDF14DRAFT_1828212 [Spinellus fusiger]|nr:hypothetical protein BDF14DRAFT_1828212 [Spinellus fusiger]